MNRHFDLAALIREARRRLSRRRVPLDAIRPRKAEENAYRAALDELLLAAVRVAKEGLNNLFGLDLRVRGVLMAMTPTVSARVAEILGDIENRHRSQWVRTVKNAVGIDLTDVIAKEDIAEEFALIVKRNVGLIKDLSENTAHRIEQAVTKASLEGRSAKELATDLEEVFGFSKRRAALIARDQTAKTVSNLNQLRQEQAGVASYIWSTSLDERVRGNPGGKYPHSKPSHWAREGQTFRWDEPPSDGHPGNPVNCRCTARAVVDMGSQ